MRYDLGLDFKALVFGAAIAAGFILLGYQYNDWLYPFSAIGLLYAGYGQGNIKTGTLMGALASTLIAILYLDGYLGQPTGFFLTENGIIAVVALIIIVGAVIGFVGAWTKRSRQKAMEEYEKQQKIGKKKNKNKKVKETPKKENNGFLNKILKK